MIWQTSLFKKKQKKLGYLLWIVEVHNYYNCIIVCRVQIKSCAKWWFFWNSNIIKLYAEKLQNGYERKFQRNLFKKIASV
jgi:hypothetical protein